MQVIVKIIKEYSLETLDFDKNLAFFVNFDYFIAPPEKGGNDANDGLTVFTPKETCAAIPSGSNVLFLPGIYNKRIKIDDPIDPYSGSFSTMLCFIGAQNLNIYGFGNNSIIDANTNVDTSVSQDAVVAGIRSNNSNLSTINLNIRHPDNTIGWRDGYSKINIRNFKVKYRSVQTTYFGCSIIRFLGANGGSQFHNCNFEMVGVYAKNYTSAGGTINYSNCTFSGGRYVGNFRGSDSSITLPDNSIDTLIKNTPLQPKKEITFHPHKQKYKPSYTLIPLVSSG